MEIQQKMNINSTIIKIKPAVIKQKNKTKQNKQTNKKQKHERQDKKKYKQPFEFKKKND